MYNHHGDSNENGAIDLNTGSPVGGMVWEGRISKYGLVGGVVPGRGLGGFKCPCYSQLVLSS